MRSTARRCCTATMSRRTTACACGATCWPPSYAARWYTSTVRSSGRPPVACWSGRTDEPMTDLAARRLGGLVVAASDEWFGAKEALLDPAPPVFDPAAYGTRGKVMDGWETRRHSPTGDDWAVVRL